MKAKLARARGHFKPELEDDATQEVRSLCRQVAATYQKVICFIRHGKLVINLADLKT